MESMLIEHIVRRFAPLMAVVLLANCATTNTASSVNTKSLLSAAGFRVRTPETDAQKELYASLPAYKMERANVKGRVFYLYKDENARVAYVGHEPEYQRYRQLCEKQKMSENFYMSENMDSIQAHRWYGEWGAKVVWR